MTTTLPNDELERFVLKQVAEQIDSPEPLDRATRIDALDIDSLDLVEIAQDVNDKFSIHIDGTVMHDAQTLGDIIDAISGILAGAVQ